MLVVFATLPILLVLVPMAGFDCPAKRVMPIGRAADAALNQYGWAFDAFMHQLGVYTAIIPAAKAGFLQPKAAWDFPARTNWGADRVGTVEPGALWEDGPQMGALLTWPPYVLVALILVITRIPALGIKQLPTMPAPALAWKSILGSSLAYSLRPLCLSFSVPFLLAAAQTIIMRMMNGKAVRATRGNSLKQMVPAAIAPAATATPAAA